MFAARPPRSGFQRAQRRARIIPLLFVLAACQPSTEERLQSARQYVETGSYQAALLELKNALRASPDNTAARALLARTSFQLADFAAAADEYQRALEFGADRKDNWIGLGKSLLRMGNAAEAFERVLPNLSDASTDVSELILQGEIYAALGNFDEAERFFQSTVEIDADSERGIIGLAIVAAAHKNHVKARRLLEQATASKAATSRSWQILGNFFRMRGNFDEATAAFQGAIEREDVHSNLADRFDTRSALISTAVDNRNLEIAKSGLDGLIAIFPGHPMLNYLRGRIAFADGDMELAASELQGYLAKVPDDVRAYAVMGAISFSQSYYRQAEMYLQQAVRGNVGGDSASRLLAETRLRLNRPQEALALLRGANLDDSPDPSLLGLLGRAEFSSGNRAAGLGFFEKGIALAPNEPTINLTYATALMSEGENEKAIEILENMPGSTDARHHREMLLIAAHERNGDRASSLRIAADLLGSNPGDAMAIALVGAFKRGIDEIQQANDHFQNALSIDPENEIALFGLASLARDRGDLSAAEGTLNTLLEVRPAYVPALTMLAQLLLPQERFDEYETRVAAAVAAAPQSSGPRVLQARAALASDNSEAALKVIRETRELFPDLPELGYLEGITLIRMGQTESALISLSRAVNAEPDNARYQFDLAVARLQSRDYFGANRAISAYRQLRKSDPVGLSVQVKVLIGLRQFAKAGNAIEGFDGATAKSGFVSVLKGDVALADNDASAAVTHFEHAAESLWDRGIALRLSSAYLAAGSAKATQPLARWLSEHPDDVPVRRSYGELLQSSGDKERAIAEYERVLAVNKNDAVALNNLAWEYSLQGRREALELARRAYELRPEEASIADTYGWILHLNGRAEEATTLLRKATKISPQNGNIQYHLAKVLADTGQREEASQIISNLLESDGSFSSRDEALGLAESL